MFLFSSCGIAQTQNKPVAPTNGSAARAATPGKSQAVPQKKAGLTRDDRAKWKAILKWEDDCPEPSADSAEYAGGLRFHELAEKRYLVEVRCQSENYKGYRLYYLYDEHRTPATAKLVELTFYRGKPAESSGDPKNWTEAEIEKRSNSMPSEIFAITESSIFSNARFDNAEKVLIVDDMIDLPHNCGTLNRYKFSGDSAELAEIKGNWLCSGEATDPETWRKLDLQALKNAAKKQN